ncbi:helix-turn-helix protein [Rhizobium sp. BK376]|nr:helix-turn-helix protein [Rhizobium sp. BK376]
MPPPPLLRAARAILGLTQIQLGEKSGVAHTTVRRLEQSVADVKPETAYKLVLAFSELGIEFARPAAGVGWRLSLRTDKR